ncbi:hypothetical protein [Bacillus sp. 1P02SD]|uniref:hypothetical protein n=1 Tax=Bacillus sp. 1P02SD TaxID=3132264 RepID=UPI00399F18F5
MDEKIICEYCDQDILDELYLTEHGAMHEECLHDYIIDQSTHYTLQEYIERINKIKEEYGL